MVGGSVLDDVASLMRRIQVSPFTASSHSHARDGDNAMPTRSASAKWEGGLKGGQGDLQRSDGTRRPVQLQLALREWSGLESRGAARGGGSGVFQHGAERRPRGERDAARRASRRRRRAQSRKSATGSAITKMVLDVTAKVPNIDDATFQKIAAATKDGCPVSKALKGIPEITLNARLG